MVGKVYVTLRCISISRREERQQQHQTHHLWSEKAQQRQRLCRSPSPPGSKRWPRVKLPEHEGVEDRHSLHFSIAVLSFYS